MSRKVNYTFLSSYKKIPSTTEEKIRSIITVESSSVAGNIFTFDSFDAPIKPITITRIEKLPTVWKKTFKIELSDRIDYNVCDSLGLVVPNPDDVVDRIMAQCSFKDIKVKIDRRGGEWFKYEGTLRDFIKFRMDLSTIPRKRLLLVLSKSARKKSELEYLCSPEGLEDYMSLAVRMNTIADILEQFECFPSVEELLVHCEIQKPRYYSLLHSEGNSEILLGVISREIDGIEVPGHVSGFIEDIYSKNRKDDSIYRCMIPIEYKFRKSTLFQGFTSKNIICFCTGTGIAPFIAFYRVLLKKGAINRLKVIYGFRSAPDNLLRYYDVDCDITLASSANGEHVYDFIDVVDDDCNIFICGNMNMQKSVFEKIKEKHPRLIQERKVYFDCWS